MNAEASQLRDLDLVRWIENKLGDTTELWSARQASSLLSKDMIIELETCFQGLESHVKLKLIQAILHLSFKLVKSWRDPLNNLLSIARRDADEWVETIADLYRDFPDKGCLHNSPSNPDSVFFKTFEELQKLFKKYVDTPESLAVLPPYCEVLCQSVIKEKYGYSEVEPKKHFTVSKNTKSEQLLEEVLKSSEQQNNLIHKKSNGIVSSFPIKMRSTARKPNNDLPMKSIPSKNTLKMSGGFTNEPKKFQRQLAKREGGAVLIDISELPRFPDNKKRKNTETLKLVNSKSNKLDSNCPTNSTGISSDDEKLKIFNNEEVKKLSENNISSTDCVKVFKSDQEPIETNAKPNETVVNATESDNSTVNKTNYFEKTKQVSSSYNVCEPTSSSKCEKSITTERVSPVYDSNNDSEISNNNSPNINSDNHTQNDVIQKQSDELLKDTKKAVKRKLFTEFLSGNQCDSIQNTLKSLRNKT